MHRCPACGSVMTKARRAPLRTCAECRHTYSDAPASDTVDRYDEEYSGFDEDPRLAESLDAIVTTRLVALRRPPARVLDVGCGNGQFMSIAAGHGYDVEGIDVSAAAVKIARERGFQATVARIEDHEGGPYDVVTMWDVIQLIPDPVAFVAAARALLAPGGRLIVKTPFQPERTIRFVGLVPRAAPAILNFGQVQFFTPDSLNAACRAAGFATSTVESIGSIRGALHGPPLKYARRAAREGLVRALGGGTNLLAVAS